MHSAIFIDCCLDQSSSEDYLPSANMNKYRYPQPDIIQSRRDLGTLGSKYDLSFKYFPSSAREIQKKNAERV